MLQKFKIAAKNQRNYRKFLNPVEVPLPVLTYSYLPKKTSKIWCDSPLKVSENKDNPAYLGN